MSYFYTHLRRGKRNPKKWNIACDLAINPIIERHGFELPEGSLNDYGNFMVGMLRRFINI